MKARVNNCFLKLIYYFIIAVIFFSFFFQFTAGFAEEKKAPSGKEESQYVKTMANILDVSLQEIWPSFAFGANPIILTFKSGHIYAFQLKAKNPVWQASQTNGVHYHFTQQDPWGVLDVPLQPSFSLEGQSAFVFAIDDMNDTFAQRFLVFLHERFHQHQFQHFYQMPVGDYQDHLNVDNLSLMQLEEILLIDFFQNKMQDREILKDYLAVHNYRKAILPVESVEWEDMQQQMEGLADYFSLRFLDVAKVVNGVDPIRIIIERLKNDLENPEITDLAIKWRHYAAGSALAYALDSVKAPRWKEKVEMEGKALSDLLEEALPMDAEELNDRIHYVMMKYNYEEVHRAVSAKLSRYLFDLDRHLTAYQKQEGVEVLLDAPSRVGLSGGGSTKRIMYLPDGSTLNVVDQSVSVTADNSWKVEYDNIPHLFKTKDGFNKFKLEKNAEITLDGKAYSVGKLLESPADYPFQRISWSGKNSNFTAGERHGCLSSGPNEITVYFE